MIDPVQAMGESIAQQARAVKHRQKRARKPLHKCYECGKRFYSTAAAERAVSEGCPGCGGSDIDVFV